MSVVFQFDSKAPRRIDVNWPIEPRFLSAFTKEGNCAEASHIEVAVMHMSESWHKH